MQSIFGERKRGFTNTADTQVSARLSMCLKISLHFRVFRYTYNYAYAHIDDVRTYSYIYIYMEKSRHSVSSLPLANKMHFTPFFNQSLSLSLSAASFGEAGEKTTSTVTSLI